MIQLPALAATVVSKLERKETQNHPFPFPSIMPGQFFPPLSDSHQPLPGRKLLSKEVGERGRGKKGGKQEILSSSAMFGRAQSSLFYWISGPISHPAAKTLDREEGRRRREHNRSLPCTSYSQGPAARDRRFLTKPAEEQQASQKKIQETMKMIDGRCTTQNQIRF